MQKSHPRKRPACRCSVTAATFQRVYYEYYVARQSQVEGSTAALTSCGACFNPKRHVITFPRQVESCCRQMAGFNAEGARENDRFSVAVARSPEGAEKSGSRRPPETTAMGTASRISSVCGNQVQSATHPTVITKILVSSCAGGVSPSRLRRSPVSASARPTTRISISALLFRRHALTAPCSLFTWACRL